MERNTRLILCYTQKEDAVFLYSFLHASKSLSNSLPLFEKYEKEMTKLQFANHFSNVSLVCLTERDSNLLINFQKQEDSYDENNGNEPEDLHEGAFLRVDAPRSSSLNIESDIEEEDEEELNSDDIGDDYGRVDDSMLERQARISLWNGFLLKNANRIRKLIDPLSNYIAEGSHPANQ